MPSLTDVTWTITFPNFQIVSHPAFLLQVVLVLVVREPGLVGLGLGDVFPHWPAEVNYTDQPFLQPVKEVLTIWSPVILKCYLLSELQRAVNCK